jgi:signal transduction histidine kinase
MNIRKQLDELQAKSLQQLLKETQNLVKEWKPETSEGKKYQQELEQVVAPFCPKGSKWSTESKQCEPIEQPAKTPDGEEKIVGLAAKVIGDDND